MKKQKILVIRSATRIVNQTLEALKREFPDSRITVLAPGSTAEAVSQDPLVDEVLTTGNPRRMTLLNYGAGNLIKLRRHRFDLAVSLYNVDHGMGYSNIDLLAWASRAGKLRGYNPQGKFVELSTAGILKKWFAEKTTLLWVGLNLAATLILFLVITLGLSVEWCIRKCAGAKKKPARDRAEWELDRVRTAEPVEKEPSRVPTRV